MPDLIKRRGREEKKRLSKKEKKTPPSNMVDETTTRGDRKDELAEQPWADEMDAIDRGSDDGLLVHSPRNKTGGDTDLLLHIMQAFPVPGELWVHLCTGCHYLSSLLAIHPIPLSDAPYIVRGQGKPPAGSPFRISYGVFNPAIRGTVVTSTTVVPNFAWTPRLAVDLAVLNEALKKPHPSNFLVLPAVRGKVVRLFCHCSVWYVADSVKIEAIPPVSATEGGAYHRRYPPLGPMAALVDVCMRTYLTEGVRGLTPDLRADRVWFFGLFPDQGTALFLGTCRLLSHYELRSNALGALDYGFSVYNDVAPSIPILPKMSDERWGLDEWNEREHSVAAAIPNGSCISHGFYRGLFDGVLLVNPMTMFAVRLSGLATVFLTPLLRGHLTLPEFLMQTALSSLYVDADRQHTDQVSCDYWTITQPRLTARFFGESHNDLLCRIDHMVCSVFHWLQQWMFYVHGLGPNEWARMEPSMQNLYFVLDHETPPYWPKVLYNHRYHPHLAKVLVFCLEYWTDPEWKQ